MSSQLPSGPSTIAGPAISLGSFTSSPCAHDARQSGLKAVCALLALVFGLTFSFGQTPATALSDGDSTELAAARSAYEAGVKELQNRVADATAKRNIKYVADLKVLGPQVAATGNLDALLAVKTEREAYESGSSTTGFDAKNQAVPAAARQLRAAFDADLEKVAKYSVAEQRNLATAYVRQLDELERKLTVATRVDAAIAVRSEKLQMQTRLASASWPAAPATTASAPPPVAEPSGEAPADFNAAAADFKAQRTAIEAEIAPKLSAREEKYNADLGALADKLNQAKHGKEAEKVKAETKRFQEHGLDSEPGKDALPEIRSMWAAYLRDVATLRQSVAFKRNGAGSRFAQALGPLEVGYRKNNDAAGLAAVKRARTALALAAAVEGGHTAVTEFSGKAGGEPWQDVAKEGGYVIGFRAGSGGWFQFSVLGSVIPIFATAEGTRDGAKRGKHDTSNTVLAKDGYAVGGIVSRGGEVVNCFQVIFMRINPDGLTLNPQDTYSSEWLGGKDGGPPKQIDTRGHLVVGISGRTENEVVSLGLVYVR